ncbi:PHB depolymerase family esterase [Thermogemmatispora sp.]|uniref:extracellular catalytic domain type 1 short-chain-length polyhydroxyalkanoate depolymerase n=1 Tax=Thermogemmatispora sp. TaxID=1968838 RepID=UPI0035E3FE07
MRKILPLTLVCSLLLVSLWLLLAGEARASGGTFSQYTYNGPAGSRPYFVYTPANYQVGTPVPLIVMLHGCTQTPQDFAAGTQMNALADQDQFVVVYPQQTSSYNSLSCWNWFLPADQARGSGEPAIIAGIVQAVEQNTSQWTIDRNRVYVAGFSAGAAMAVILGATYPDVFAAIASASGLEYQAATSQSAATTAMMQGGPNPQQQGQAAYQAMGSAARVVPTIVFQGQSDYTVYPVNGDQVVEQWMTTDHLASNGSYNASFSSPSSSVSGQVAGGHSYTVQSWNDAQGNEIQEYWKINGMGHAWSGGSSSGSYTDPQGPSATNAIYSFFMQHPLKGGGSGGTATPTSSPSPTPSATAPGATPTPTPDPTAVAASCQVHYGIVGQWSGGFQASLTITNTGSSAINGWTLRFSFAAGQMITLSWNGNFSQAGSAVTVTNVAVNAQIPPHGSLSVPPGFQATWSGSNPPPTAFSLNGQSCAVV